MRKPIIVLFSTPNRNYVFDVNKNEVIPLSDDSYAYLQQVLRGKGADLPVPPQVHALKEQGYCATDSCVKEVRHVYADYLDVFLTRKLSKITLQLTQNCNYYNRFPQDEVSPIARRSLLSAMKDYEQIEAGAALRKIDAPAGPCIPGQLSRRHLLPWNAVRNRWRQHHRPMAT